MDPKLLHEAIDEWINRLGQKIRNEWYQEHEPSDLLAALSDQAASRAYHELMKLLPEDFARENKLRDAGDNSR